MTIMSILGISVSQNSTLTQTITYKGISLKYPANYQVKKDHLVNAKDINNGWHSIYLCNSDKVVSVTFQKYEYSISGASFMVNEQLEQRMKTLSEIGYKFGSIKLNDAEFTFKNTSLSFNAAAPLFVSNAKGHLVCFFYDNYRGFFEIGSTNYDVDKKVLTAIVRSLSVSDE